MAYKDKNDPRAKESRKRWYKRNKERQIKAQNTRKEFNKLFLKRWKNTQHCRDCGISFKNQTWLCDLHHLNNKKELVSRMMTYSLKSIKEEIRKCVPLCANCHRNRHKEDLYT